MKLFSFHSQRLSRLSGRCWLKCGKQSLNLEFGAKPALELDASCVVAGFGDSHVTLHINVFGLYLYVCPTLSVLVPLYRWAGKRQGTRTGLRLCWEQTPQLRIDVLTSEYEWRSRDPWWRKGKTIDFADVVFGQREYDKVEGPPVPVIIPMPEGSYAGTAKTERSVWRRKRWPIPLIRESIWIDVPGGIPFAGKGENSWDCGDDGLWGTGCTTTSIEEAIGHVVTSVLRSRSRYGHASYLAGRAPVMAPERPAEPAA